MMNFQVLPRNKAKKLSYKELPYSCVIILITDPGEEPVLFATNPGIKAVLKLQFEDVIDESPLSMDSRDAERIIDFVNIWKDSVESIVVHCEAGISRSAGVCSALMLWINGNDNDIYNNPFFHPNRLCRSLLLEELIKREYL